MISTQDIKNKEVINIYDGKSLGFVEDIEVNLERGTIEGIIVPEPRGFFSFFGRSGEQVIRWRDIKRIGDDVILVDVAGVLDSDYEEGGRDFGGYDRDYRDGYEGGRRFEASAARTARPARDSYRDEPAESPRDTEREFDRTQNIEVQENEDDFGK